MYQNPGRDGFPAISGKSIFRVGNDIAASGAREQPCCFSLCVFFLVIPAHPGIKSTQIVWKGYFVATMPTMLILLAGRWEHTFSKAAVGGGRKTNATTALLSILQ
jgi:hypothetical protein